MICDLISNDCAGALPYLTSSPADVFSLQLLLYRSSPPATISGLSLACAFHLDTLAPCVLPSLSRLNTPRYQHAYIQQGTGHSLKPPVNVHPQQGTHAGPSSSSLVGS